MEKEEENGEKDENKSKKSKVVLQNNFKTCMGLLKVIYWRTGHHTFKDMSVHICTSRHRSDGTKIDNRVPMTVVAPSVHWNVLKETL
jgi:hypothetical protein